jgi:hypothetical protein
MPPQEVFFAITVLFASAETLSSLLKSNDVLDVTQTLNTTLAHTRKKENAEVLKIKEKRAQTTHGYNSRDK